MHDRFLKRRPRIQHLRGIIPMWVMLPGANIVETGRLLFGSGLSGTRTAIYHANGQRRDTRSVLNRNQLPCGGTT